jgi:hypothetical protein
VSSEPFIDYYDLLQLSPNADEDTIHRIFRHLAKKHHPDHNGSGDSAKFRLLVEAHGILTNDETRAGYDAKYQEYWNRKWKLASDATQGTAFAEDAETRHKILSLLYVQRRRDMRAPGLGEYELSRLLRTPIELVDFHLWYLREKGSVMRVETGQIAISAHGVEEIERTHLRFDSDRLLATRGESPADDVPDAPAAGGRTLEEGDKQG